MSNKEARLNEKELKPISRFLSVTVLIISALTLFNSYYNLLDITPDFPILFILAAIAGRYSAYAPYFAEVRSGLIKLGVLSVIKYPALLLMWGNIGTGHDILPLFSIVFAAFEVIIALPLVSDTFSALYYVGERGDCPATIKSINLKIVKLSPDTVKNSLYIFIVLRSVLSVLPEMLLLTTVSESATRFLRSLYLPATGLSLVLVLLIGLFVMLLSVVYAASIIREGKLSSTIYNMAGAETIEREIRDRGVRKKLILVSALILSSLLLFDVTFSDINYGVNILPHAVYGITITVIGYLLAERERSRIFVLIAGALYSVASIVSHHLALGFNREYELIDLIEKESARMAYIPYEISAVAELLCFAALIFVFAHIFVKFITANTGAVSDDPNSPQTRAWRSSLTSRGYVFAYFPLLILLLKTVYAFITNNVVSIFIQGNNISLAPIVTTELPWWPFMVIGVGVAYVFYSYLFLTELKDEIKLKYSDEKITFE